MNLFLRKSFALPAAFASLFLAGPVFAVVVSNNFGPGDSFAPTFLFVSGPASGTGESDIAAAFTPGSNVFLDSIEVALANFEGSASVQVGITTDLGGLPNPTFLGEISVIAPAVPGIVIADFDNTLLLQSGNKYWVWLSAPNDGDNNWYDNNQGIMTPAAFSQSGGPFSVFEGSAPAFRVNGIVVPEPTSAVLVLVGFLGMMRRRR